MRGRTRVKICGITREQDLHAAAAAGADAVGVVLWPHSSRAVTIDQARALAARRPPFITLVGLFVDPDPAFVREAIGALRLDCLQFHGDEAAEFCAAFDRPWLKALRARPGLDLTAAMAHYEGAQGILVDAYDPATPGGSGTVFDWTRLPMSRLRPLVLAGGLDPRNVAEAVARVRPWAVDVSSGVESAPGIKDPDAIAAFVAAVAAAQAAIAVEQ
jgi:phosphoribosylanthranilate isomerase